MASACNCYDASEWSGAMSTSHFTTVTSATVIGGETGLSFASGSR